MDPSAGQVLAYLLWMTGVGIFLKARWVARGVTDLPVLALLCWGIGGVALAWATLGSPILAVPAWCGACLAAWCLWTRLIDVVQEWRMARRRSPEPRSDAFDSAAWGGPPSSHDAPGLAHDARTPDPQALRNETDAERSHRIAKMFQEG